MKLTLFFMKIPTIKTFFTKVELPAKKGKLAVSAAADKPKKTISKKPAVKSAVAKTGVVKKPITSALVVKKVAKKNTVKPPIKKVLAKTVVKKTPVKKISTPVTKTKLVVASDSQSFWISDGQILNSLPALEAALKVMPVAVYRSHADSDSNHFADWVELVLGDKICAVALRKAKTAKSAAVVVQKHLNSLA